MQLIQLKLNNDTVHQVTEANVADLLFENYKMLVKSMIGGKKLVAKKLTSLKKPYEKLKKNLNKVVLDKIQQAIEFLNSMV